MPWTSHLSRHVMLSEQHQQIDSSNAMTTGSKT
uniref:ATP binding protein n=1 Tax=Rhizophora mucronata TaxID=61149 RepID=A0A2P2J5U7_RHIMU